MKASFDDERVAAVDGTTRSQLGQQERQQVLGLPM